MCLLAYPLQDVAVMYCEEQLLIMHKNYNKKDAEMLLHNFYIDDLLKSVETEEIAIQLIKDIIRL